MAGCRRAGLGASFSKSPCGARANGQGSAQPGSFWACSLFWETSGAGAGRLFLPVFSGDKSWRPRVRSPAGALGLPGRCCGPEASLWMLCALPREGAPGLRELAAAASRALITAQLAHFLNSYLRRRAR